MIGTNTSPNDEAHLPAGLSELPTSASLYAPPVRCSAGFGPGLLDHSDRRADHPVVERLDEAGPRRLGRMPDLERPEPLVPRLGPRLAQPLPHPGQPDRDQDPPGDGPLLLCTVVR